MDNSKFLSSWRNPSELDRKIDSDNSVRNIHIHAGNFSRSHLFIVKQALGHRAISSTKVHVGTSDNQASEAAAEAMMAMY
jgi:hypothetical protein